MKAFKKHRDYGFFDQDIRLTKLSKLGDPLEKLSKGVDFEEFRNILETKLSKEAKGKHRKRKNYHRLRNKTRSNLNASNTRSFSQKNRLVC